MQTPIIFEPERSHHPIENKDMFDNVTLSSPKSIAFSNLRG
jgi:hypothetical protein